MRLRVFPVVFFCATAIAAACSSSDDSGSTPDPITPGEEGGTSSGSSGSSGSSSGSSGSSSGSSGSSGTSGGPGDGGADAADAADAAPVITYKNYDINHVLSTGASDSVANGASAFVTTTQPWNNVSFDTGVFTSGNCNGDGCPKTTYQAPTGFKPLVEGDNFFTYGVETISSGLANQATVFAKAYFQKVGLPYTDHVVLVSNHGRSGNPYWCERLQTENVQPGYGPCYFPLTENLLAPFDEALMQVQAGKDLATATGKTYAVRGVTVIAGQGESDSNEQNFTFLVSTDGKQTPLVNYTNALYDWQWDYETKVQAITGQTEPVPFFISQFGSLDTPDSIIPQRQLDAQNNSNGKINLVTPNYPMTHYTDCLHYTAYSQRRIGAYMAKAYESVVIEGKKWEPTHPVSITRGAGNTLLVKYHVPVPPLVVDTTRVRATVPTEFPNPTVLGFVFRDDSNSAYVTAAAVTAPDTVTVTLSGAPTGTNQRLRYAYERQTAAAGQCPGPQNGQRGNIRDSDPTLGYYNGETGTPYELFNWSMAFEMPLPP